MGKNEFTYLKIRECLAPKKKENEKKPLEVKTLRYNVYHHHGQVFFIRFILYGRYVFFS
jgi:hypothetical protein